MNNARNIIMIPLLAVLLAAAAFGQPSSCTVSGYVYGNDLQVARNVYLTVKKVQVSGFITAIRDVDYKTDSTGFISMTLIRNSICWIEGMEALGFNVPGGVRIPVPNAPTATLESVVPTSTVPSMYLVAAAGLYAGKNALHLIDTLKFTGAGAVESVLFKTLTIDVPGGGGGSSAYGDSIHVADSIARRARDSASNANRNAATALSRASTAYGWGNHASAGYLTGYTESDPVAGALAAEAMYHAWQDSVLIDIKSVDLNAADLWPKIIVMTAPDLYVRLPAPSSMTENRVLTVVNASGGHAEIAYDDAPRDPDGGGGTDTVNTWQTVMADVAGNAWHVIRQRTETDPVWNAQKSGYATTGHGHSGTYVPVADTAKGVSMDRDDTIKGEKTFNGVLSFLQSPLITAGTPTAGHVWTCTGTNGGGNWAAAAGGGGTADSNNVVSTNRNDNNIQGAKTFKSGVTYRRNYVASDTTNVFWNVLSSSGSWLAQMRYGYAGHRAQLSFRDGEYESYGVPIPWGQPEMNLFCYNNGGYVEMYGYNKTWLTIRSEDMGGSRSRIIMSTKGDINLHGAKYYTQGARTDSAVFTGNGENESGGVDIRNGLNVRENAHFQTAKNKSAVNALSMDTDTLKVNETGFIDSLIARVIVRDTIAYMATDSVNFILQEWKQPVTPKVTAPDEYADSEPKTGHVIYRFRTSKAYCSFQLIADSANGVQILGVTFTGDAPKYQLTALYHGRSATGGGFAGGGGTTFDYVNVYGIGGNAPLRFSCNIVKGASALSANRTRYACNSIGWYFEGEMDIFYALPYANNSSVPFKIKNYGEGLTN